MNTMQNFNSYSLLSYTEQRSFDSCGYCKSTRRAQSKLQKINTVDNKAGNSKSTNDNETTTQSKSLNFGVIAHIISLEIFNRFLDFGWSLWAYRLKINDYQSLVDVGWRRSGKYLYKPIMEETCCPQYTIRLDVNKFKISKTQKRILRTMFNFLQFDKRPTKIFEEQDFQQKKDEDLLQEKKKEKKIFLKENKTPRTNNTLKKKTIRRIKAEEKLKSKGIDIDKYKLKRKQKEESRKRTLESFFKPYVENEWKHKLEVRLVSITSKEFLETYFESFLLYKKYQEIVHEDSNNSEESFKRFLVSSPFVLDNTENESTLPDIIGGIKIKPKEMLLGSYHQQYLLDGKIIAIGVIDILTRCFSSKYFFYDPDYNFLSFGTFSALSEIRFTKALACIKPQIHYYYMGFYVYNCPKMRYKGRFCPSELLCDKTHKWVDLTECKKILALNNGKFTPFCNTSDSKSNDDTIDIDDIQCVVNLSVAMPFREFRKKFLTSSKMISDLKIFAKYVGSLAKDVLLIYTP